MMCGVLAPLPIMSTLNRSSHVKPEGNGNIVAQDLHGHTSAQ